EALAHIVAIVAMFIPAPVITAIVATIITAVVVTIVTAIIAAVLGRGVGRRGSDGAGDGGGGGEGQNQAFHGLVSFSRSRRKRLSARLDPLMLLSLPPGR